MRIEVLVGMVGSGKSTYARGRARQGALVVCHDDLTAMLHAGDDREGRGYELVLRDCYRQCEDSIAFHALSWGRDAIIDRTNLTREARRRWVDLARIMSGHLRRDVILIAVAFPIATPGVHALRRFEADPRGRSYDEWSRVAEHHHAQALAEPPSTDEGFGEIVRMGDQR